MASYIFNNLFWAFALAAWLYVEARKNYPRYVFLAAVFGFFLGLFTSFFGVIFISIALEVLKRAQKQQPRPTENSPTTSTTFGDGANQTPIPMPSIDMLESVPSVAGDAYEDVYSAPSSAASDAFGTFDSSLPSDDVQRRLNEIESYLQQGIISKKEYNQMRRDILRGR